MPALRIPDSGLLLEGSGSKSAASLPAQAFAITLSDNVIEDMIKCVQSGEDIQLSLGSSPVSCVFEQLQTIPAWLLHSAMFSCLPNGKIRFSSLHKEQLLRGNHD